MQTQDLLLNGMLRNQPDDRHRTSLSQAVGPVLGLFLYGRIPPRVGDDDIVRRSKIQSQSSCLQAHKEDRTDAGLELRDKHLTFLKRSAAIQIEVVVPFLREHPADDVQE